MGSPTDCSPLTTLRRLELLTPNAPSMAIRGNARAASPQASAP